MKLKRKQFYRQATINILSRKINIATAIVWSAFRENQPYSVQNQATMSIPECKLLLLCLSYAFNDRKKRNLSTRLTEHKRATRNGNVNNNIVEHHLQTKHQIDWDSATCITYSTDYYQRLTLESWFTNLERVTSAVQATY